MKKRKAFNLFSKAKKTIASLFMICLVTATFAQDNPEQKDFMESNGKIYVVMAVVIVIVLGLFLYLFGLDRKIRKIEKNSK
jgi:hypothetical protein